MIDLVQNTTLKETRDITETSTTEDSQIDIIIAGALQYLFCGNHRKATIGPQKSRMMMIAIAKAIRAIPMMDIKIVISPPFAFIQINIIWGRSKEPFILTCLSLIFGN